MSHSDKIIGVLGLQGAVIEHIQQIENLGLHGIIVKKPEQLEHIDGIILPGGESTTMRKIIDRYGFFQPLQQFATLKPIFGTCAGMVLLAKKLVGTNESHLGLIDIEVKRNAFGRQIDSFEAALKVKGLDSPYPAVFIRAPYIESTSNEVEVLAKHNNHIVAARQGKILVTSFHPELTADNRFLKLFVEMVHTKELQSN